MHGGSLSSPDVPAIDRSTVTLSVPSLTQGYKQPYTIGNWSHFTLKLISKIDCLIFMVEIEENEIFLDKIIYVYALY